MDGRDKWRLQVNQEQLLSDIPTFEVATTLFAKNLLTRNDRERIELKPETEKKNYLLLYILETKGPGAYDKFREALMERECKHLVDMLDSTSFEDYNPPDDCIPKPRDEVIQQMTVLDVKQWLEEMCKLSGDEANKFVSQEIDGLALNMLFQQENYFGILNDICEITWKKRLMIKTEFDIIEDYLQTLSRRKELESLSKKRTTEATSMVEKDEFQNTLNTGGEEAHQTYKKNTTITKHINDNLLDPVHIFIPCEDALLESKCVYETACSIAACINSFQNGRILLGVEKYEAGHGLIHGFSGDDTFKQNFVGCVLKQFLQDHQPVVAKLITCEFVDVEDPENTKSGLIVAKIDVVPVSTNRDEVFITQHSKSGLQFFVWKDLIVKKLENQEKKLFLKERGVCHKARKIAENGGDWRPPYFYSKKVNKLVDTVTLGNKFIESGMFPILVLNSPPANTRTRDIQERFSFVKDVQWTAIFDFDSEGKICNYLDDQGESISIKKVDEIPLEQHEDGKLLTTKSTPWFCMNGLEEENITDPVLWRKKNLEGLQTLTGILKNEVPEERAIIVFALMSENFQIMVEMFSEVDRKFPNQWIVLCEQEELLTMWNKEIVNRKVQNEDTLHDRSIGSLPWHLVSENFKLLIKPKVNVVCTIPSSCGNVVLTNKNDLTCLDVIGIDECKQELKELSKISDINNLKREEEMRFFKGAKVSWRNFAFEGQVCKRSMHSKLSKIVQDALEGKVEDTTEGKSKPPEYVDGDYVGFINLYHQPGAGATTTSRNILWDLKSKYRCAVVKEIIPSQTSKQVFTLRQYGEESEIHTRPVLLLVDNENTESIRQLRAELEELAKKSQWEAEALGQDCHAKESAGTHYGKPIQNQVSIVVLVCKRQITIKEKEDFALRHKLTKEELKWFANKYDNLEREYKNGNRLNPKLLLSFNIMKTNFNQKAISEVVRKLVDAMTDEKEKKALKYLVLLNCFDQEFRAIPVSVFDSLMAQKQTLNQSFGLVRPWRQRSMGLLWEKNTSEEWKLLVSEASETRIHRGLTTCNVILAREILDNFVKKQPVSQIMNEFLDCKGIFPKNPSSSYLKTVNRIVCEILTIRAQEESLDKTYKYSPLINEVMKKETHQIAAELLIKGFELFQDPFIAQQTSRFFMYSNDSYDDITHHEALKYAKEGLTLKPENPKFHDTYGQVYKQRLAKALRSLKVDHDLVPPIEVVQDAFAAITAFKDAQHYSTPEAYKGVNKVAGYYGELDAACKLLDFFEGVYNFDGDKWRKFFFSHDFCPEELSNLKNVNGVNFVDKLKSLGETVYQTLVVVEELESQVREEYLDSVQLAQEQYGRTLIAKVKEKLQHFYGEKDDKIPETLHESGKCSFRQRRAYRLAGYSFSENVKNAKTKKPGKAREIFFSVCSLMRENLSSSYKSTKDLLILLGSCITSSSILKTPLENMEITFEDLVMWSHQLYKDRTKLPGIYLEPYLFYVILNWPSYDVGIRQDQALPTPLNEVFRYWKIDYDKKYPVKGRRTTHGVKERNVFFLAKGSNMQRFMTPSMFTIKYFGKNFWNSGEVQKDLHQFQGRLSERLDSVVFSFGSLRDQILNIPTAVQVPFDEWKNKKVCFYVGLTWAGPVAYGSFRPSSSTDSLVYSSPRQKELPSETVSPLIAASSLDKKQSIAITKLEPPRVVASPVDQQKQHLGTGQTPKVFSGDNGLQDVQQKEKSLHASQDVPKQGPSMLEATDADPQKSHTDTSKTPEGSSGDQGFQVVKPKRKSNKRKGPRK